MIRHQSSGISEVNYLTFSYFDFKAPRLAAQREFVSALIAVGRRLRTLPTKDLKSKSNSTANTVTA